MKRSRWEHLRALNELIKDRGIFKNNHITLLPYPKMWKRLPKKGIIFTVDLTPSKRREFFSTNSFGWNRLSAILSMEIAIYPTHINVGRLERT